MHYSPEQFISICSLPYKTKESGENLWPVSFAEAVNLVVFSSQFLVHYKQGQQVQEALS